MCGSASRPSVPRRSSASPPGPSKGATTVAASVAASRGGGRASSHGRRGARERRDEGASATVRDLSPEEQLGSFLARYTPAIAAEARAVLAKMRSLLPGAIELVYDNYNALAIGFGSTERTSAAVFSVAIFPRWVSLFFLHGANLPDPKPLLKGSGKAARHVVLYGPEPLDLPEVYALMVHALKRASPPLDPRRPSRVVIKSVSVKQRPRRPKALKTARASRPRWPA